MEMITNNLTPENEPNQSRGIHESSEFKDIREALNRSGFRPGLWQSIYLECVNICSQKSSLKNSPEIALIKTTLLEVIKERSTNRVIFDREVTLLFSKTNEESQKFCKTIDYRLYQFNLKGIYEPKEIMSSAYVRAVEQIAKGQSIRCVEAWLRKTCFYIISELSRAQKSLDNRHRKAEQLSFILSESVINQVVSPENLDFLEKALHKLKPDEIELIKLRNPYGKRRTWKEVAELIPGKTISPGNLRTRYCRILKKLSQEFWNLKGTQEGE